MNIQTQYLESKLTGNKLLLTDKIVVKVCATAMSERHWYRLAEARNIPCANVISGTDEILVMQRLYGKKPTCHDLCGIIFRLRGIPSESPALFQSYIDNIPDIRIKSELSKYNPTASFFHGDLSTTNIIDGKVFDPNYKNIFGNWQTDAGKAVFSFIAYENDFQSAKHIADLYGGKIIWLFAASEGSRVAKYNSKYNDFVLNILDIYESVPTI